MKRTSRMIIFPRKEEKCKKKNFGTHEIRPFTMSEVLEMISSPRQHFRAGLSRVFLPQGNKQHHQNQALRG